MLSINTNGVGVLVTPNAQCHPLTLGSLLVVHWPPVRLVVVAQALQHMLRRSFDAKKVTESVNTWHFTNGSIAGT